MGDYKLRWDYYEDGDGSTMSITSANPAHIIYVCPDPVIETYRCIVTFSNTITAKDLFFRGHTQHGGYVSNLILDDITIISTTTTAANPSI
jgi:hypothetical protein